MQCLLLFLGSRESALTSVAGMLYLLLFSDMRFHPPWGALMCPQLLRSGRQRVRRNRFFFCLFNTLFIMDAEHTLSPEATSENVIESISTEEMEALRIYFERYSQEMLTSFRLNLSSTDDLPHFLLRQLEKTKDLFSTLEQPWSRYIPILYQALALYFIHVPEQKKRQKYLLLEQKAAYTALVSSQIPPENI